MKAALGAKADPDVPVDLRHAAQLVIEIAYADAGLGAEERARVENDLRQRWGLAPRATPPAEPAHEEEADCTASGSASAGRWSASAGSALIEQMWQSLFADRTHRLGPGGLAPGEAPPNCSACAPDDVDRSPRRQSLTTSDLRAFWLEGFRDYLTLEAGHSPHTVENYQRDLRRLAEFARIARASPARKSSRGRSCATSCSFSRI